MEEVSLVHQSDKKPKILIVDDMPTNIHMLINTLKGPYELVPAKDGETALQKAQSFEDLDLIILDIMMPGMDGYEVCKKLKSNEKTKNIPIIFVTAVSEAADKARGFELGAVDYITKPFIPVVVRARVKTHIELKQKSDMLEKMASIDSLTQIYNRRKFDSLLATEWSRMQRKHDDLALILIDIDHFKLYNDNYGHAQGDECLKQVAKAMQGVLPRPADFLGRYGGEEFVVVLPETDLKGAQTVAHRLKDAVESMSIPHEYSKTTKYITVSLGVSAAIPNEIDASPQVLTRCADKMLYQAKENGRNNVAATCLNDKMLKILD